MSQINLFILVTKSSPYKAFSPNHLKIVWSHDSFVNISLPYEIASVITLREYIYSTWYVTV